LSAAALSGEAEVEESFASLAEEVGAPFADLGGKRRTDSQGEVASAASAVAQSVVSSGPGSNEADLMELGGFEPPTSWVRSNGAKCGRRLQKCAISRDLAGLRDCSACRHIAADTQGYAAICRESGTPSEKCPKFAQGGWK